MVTSIAVTQAITTIQAAHERLNITRTDDEAFFFEWQAQLPTLSLSEVSSLQHLQERYLYYLESGEISEGTANIIMISPLLNALGLCDPPYRIKGEQWVRIALETDTEEGPTVLEGRIDALTLQEDTWLVVIEGKRGGFNVLQAIPQALAYMMGSPNRKSSQQYPTYGLVTNGYDYLFLKLGAGDTPEYALSHNFTLLSDDKHNLQRVARILKRLIAR